MSSRETELCQSDLDTRALNPSLQRAVIRSRLAEAGAGQRPGDGDVSRTHWMNALRPLVVELVGPAGAGKSELLKSLAGRDPSVPVDMHVWTLPGQLLVLSALHVR